MVESSVNRSIGMIDSRYSRVGTGLLILLAITIPGALFYQHNASYAAFYLLVLWGAIAWFRSGEKRFDKEEVTVALTLALAVFTAWLSFAYNGFRAEGWTRFLDGQTPLLGILPVFVLFRTLRGSAAAMWWSVSAGALLCGALAISELMARTPADGLIGALEWALDTRYRSSAGDHPLPLALASLVLGAATAAGWRYFARFRWWGKIYWAIALGLAALALFLTETRGA